MFRSVPARSYRQTQVLDLEKIVDARSQSLTLVADQASKQILLTYLHKVGAVVPVFDGFFRLVEVWNRTTVPAIMVTPDVDEAILLADRVVMMTNGPNATIGKVLKVDLPRPRDRKALLKDPQFYAYRQEVLHFLAEYDHGPHVEAA